MQAGDHHRATTDLCKIFYVKIKTFVPIFIFICMLMLTKVFPSSHKMCANQNEVSEMFFMFCSTIVDHFPAHTLHTLGKFTEVIHRREDRSIVSAACGGDRSSILGVI